MGSDLQQLLPENIAQALCRTLVHSLWQGLITAMLTGVIILFTRKSSAAKRYLWLVSVLCLFTVSSLFTLFITLGNQPLSDVVAQNDVAAAPADFWALINYNLLYIQTHAGMIVLIWLTVVFARSLKLLVGFYAVERLKRSKVSRISPEWEQKLNALAQTLGIKRAVGLLESAIVRVPVVIGYLKPLILIPVGMVNALGQQEVEAILAHELAHIGRHDYLVNLLQSFVETIFFFNPAVFWLSSLIRAEREHCCDDVAVSHTKNKVRYISALVHFEEYSKYSPRFAQGLTGKNGGMLQRLERMAANRNRSLNKLELASLALLLLLGSLFIAARPAPKLGPVAYKTAPVPVSPELRKQLHEIEIALSQSAKGEGASTPAEAVPISPELRKYIHDREVAVANHVPGAVPLTPQFKKYIHDREVALAKTMKAGQASQPARTKDSLP